MAELCVPDCCEPTREELEAQLASAEAGRERWKEHALELRRDLQRIFEATPKYGKRIALEALARLP
jgi:hypothetical protein